MLNVPSPPSQRNLRWFGILGMLLILFFIAGLPTGKGDFVRWTSIVSVGLLVGLIGWQKPRWLTGIYLAWMWVVFPIGWLMAHLLLGIVYFGVLTPIGCLLRQTGHDPMQQHVDPTKTTFWRLRKKERPPASYFRQF